MNRGKCINVVALSEDNKRKRKRRRIKAQHHVDRLGVKQSAVRHMLKEAMVNKEYNNSAFHKAYLEKIGFTSEQIHHLKKTLLTSELRSYLKHQNKDKRDSKAVQQEMEDMLMHQSQDADEDIMMKFKSYNNTEPTELRISFDIDRLDPQDREIYYPDDNVNKVIERLNLRNILVHLADMSPGREKQASNEVAGKLIKLFMGRSRRYGRR